MSGKNDLVRTIVKSLKGIEDDVPPVEVVKLYNNIKHLAKHMKWKYKIKNESCLALQEKVMQDIENLYTLKTEKFFVYNVQRSWFGRFFMEHYDVYEHLLKIRTELEKDIPGVDDFVLTLNIDPECGDTSDGRGAT